MARPQSVARLNYYPFPEACLPLLMEHIAVGDAPQEATMLDPCAGKGVAAFAIAGHLGMPGENVHLVELATDRSAAIRAARPDVNLLGPCSFMGTQISYNGFSLAYVNCPFQDELGGGRREELSFFVRVSNLVAPGGVMVAVLPESVVFDYGSGAEGMRTAIDCRYERVEVYRLPEAQRHYKEIVVLGVKRKQIVPPGEGPLTRRNSWWWNYRDNEVGTLGEAKSVYRVPPGKKPKRFLKVDFTPEELARKVAASPLAKLLEPPAPASPPSPPLPLAKGHVALILAAGDLDGLVFPEGEPPHVVRGTARKVSVRDHERCEENHNEDGSVSSKEVYVERICLTVRAIDVTGTIHNFTDTPVETA